MFGTTSNFQGSYKLLCIRTGRRITRKQNYQCQIPSSRQSRHSLTEINKKAAWSSLTEMEKPMTTPINTNQPIDGVAGVDTADETAHDEQEQEMVEMPGVPGTIVEDLEIPAVEPLENLEIPGVEPIENLEIPGVDTEEMDPDNM
jgi:hypothetical protein